MTHELPAFLALAVAVAAGAYLAIAILMDQAGINLDHLDDMDQACALTCNCDDCIFWQLVDEAR